MNNATPAAFYNAFSFAVLKFNNENPFPVYGSPLMDANRVTGTFTQNGRSINATLRANATVAQDGTHGVARGPTRDGDVEHHDDEGERGPQGQQRDLPNAEIPPDAPRGGRPPTAKSGRKA